MKKLTGILLFGLMVGISARAEWSTHTPSKPPISLSKCLLAGFGTGLFMTATNVIGGPIVGGLSCYFIMQPLLSLHDEITVSSNSDITKFGAACVMCALTYYGFSRAQYYR